MTDYIHRLIVTVTAAANRVHGRCSSHADYCAALARELRAAGISVRVHVDLSELYGDVEIRHCLDLVADAHLGIEVRSLGHHLPPQNSAALLAVYLEKAGLSWGLVVDFAGSDVAAIPVSVAASSGGTEPY